jgi:hypothetical protein
MNSAHVKAVEALKALLKAERERTGNRFLSLSAITIK